MRNTRLYIIISVVILIIVGIIATILSNQLKKGNESANNKQSTEKIESSGTRSLSRIEKTKEASRITKQSNTSLLSDEQVKKLDVLCTKVSKEQNGVLSNEDFDISCSTITNQIYIQKKTDKADAQLESFLKENNALDILQTDPSLFVRTNQPLSTYIKDQENYLLEQLSEDNEMPQNSTNNKTSSETTSTSAKIIQDLATLTDLFKILRPLDIPTPTVGQISQSNSTTVNGTLFPPNLAPQNASGYFMMPSAPNGEYTFGGWNFCGAHSYGSKELISAIYTAAMRWKAKYPQYTFRVGDLNGRKVPAYQGHSSHGNGVDVDIVTYGNWNLQINAPTEVNIDLGKAFIDTGVVKLIIFGGEADKYKPRPQLVTVTNAWRTYSNSLGLPFQTYATGNHDNHFHIRINDQFRLKEYRPRSPC